MANIFVGNLSYFCTHVELAELFATAVPVVKASIRRNKEGDSRHFGFVEIESEEDAENAIAAFDGVAFMGRILRVKSCHSSLQDSPTSPRCDQIQIHVSFLSNKAAPQVNEAFLIDHLTSRFGPVVDCLIKRYLVSHHPVERQAGYGFVVFQELADAQRAMAELTGASVMDGISLDCKFSREYLQYVADTNSMSPRPVQSTTSASETLTEVSGSSESSPRPGRTNPPSSPVGYGGRASLAFPPRVEHRTSPNAAAEIACHPDTSNERWRSTEPLSPHTLNGNAPALSIPVPLPSLHEDSVYIGQQRSPPGPVRSSDGSHGAHETRSTRSRSVDSAYLMAPRQRSHSFDASRVRSERSSGLRVTNDHQPQTVSLDGSQPSDQEPNMGPRPSSLQSLSAAQYVDNWHKTHQARANHSNVGNIASSDSSSVAPQLSQQLSQCFMIPPPLPPHHVLFHAGYPHAYSPQQQHPCSMAAAVTTSYPSTTMSSPSPLVPPQPYGMYVPAQQQNVRPLQQHQHPLGDPQVSSISMPVLMSAPAPQVYPNAHLMHLQSISGPARGPVMMMVPFLSSPSSLATSPVSSMAVYASPTATSLSAAASHSSTQASVYQQHYHQVQSPHWPLN